MSIFIPGWKSNDKSKALKAVEKETSSQKLCEIAKTAPLSEVRIKAIEKITDDSILRDIALNADNKEIRKTALFRISNEEYLPLKEKGCEFFGMEHTWQNGDGCFQLCPLCGGMRVHHVWKQGVCLKCDAHILDVEPLTEFRLSDILRPDQRGVIVNALDYAVRNWGNAEEEAQIRILMKKCAHGEPLEKSDAMLLNRIYKTLRKLFRNNPELNIEQMSLLSQISDKMQ